MQSPCRVFSGSPSSWIYGRLVLAPTRRKASLTSAIERGKRRSNAAVERRWQNNDSPRQKDERQYGLATEEKERITSRPFKQDPFPDRPTRESWRKQGTFEKSRGSNEDIRRTPTARFSRDEQRDPEEQGLKITRTPTGPKNAGLPSNMPKVPLSIPYTTPASEFLYGIFAAMAALKARRRKFYKLYILREEGSEVDRTVEVEELARSRRVRIQYVGSDWTGILNKMAENRPHNGVILETSPLPKLPVRGLESADAATDPIRLRLDNMSEEELEVSGGSSVLPRKVRAARYPFVLLLDRVLDPGNMGAIIRSAYFLGIDAVVMSRSGSAPTSAVTVKASAGAAEAMPLLTANAPLDFVKRSKQNGWQIFAAVSPSSESGQLRQEKFVPAQDAVTNGSVILVVGGEGEGIARSLMREVTGYVGINQVARDDGLDLIESLNVSVATALMIQQFLQSPPTRTVADIGDNSNSLQASSDAPERVF